MVFVLTIFIIFISTSQVMSEAGHDLSAELNNLKSERRKVWRRARSNLISEGSSAVTFITNNYKSLTTLQRFRIVTILAALKEAEADKMLVDIAVSEKNTKIRKRSIAVLKKGLNATCRKHLIAKAKDKSPVVRNKALSLIKQLKNKNPELINDLINDLESELEAEVTDYSATFDVNITQLKHSGYTTYPTKMKMNTPKGPVMANSDIRMPSFSSRSVKTRVTLPAGKVLRLVTGKNFGHDTRKWRNWLKKRKR